MEANIGEFHKGPERELYKYINRHAGMVLSTCYSHFIPIVVVGKRGAFSLVHGDLPRQHSFGTTLRFTGPAPTDSRQ